MDSVMKLGARKKGRGSEVRWREGERVRAESEIRREKRVERWG